MAADPEFMTDSELSRREMFANAYCVHGALSKAAQVAGYTGNNNTLRKQGWRLISEPAVKARIEQIRADALLELGITQRAILGEYARIAFADLGECFDENGDLRKINDIPINTRRALAGFEITTKTFGEDGESIEKKVKMAGKEAALAKLGAHLNMFKTGEDDKGIDAKTFLALLMAGRSRVDNDRGHGGAGS